MSTAQANELSAVAFQLAAKLESYESVLDTMADQRAKLVRCSLLTREVEQIGWFISEMPHIAVDIVDLTLRHFELMRLLSKPVEPGTAVSRNAVVMLRKQSAALKMLRVKCIRLIARS